MKNVLGSPARRAFRQSRQVERQPGQQQEEETATSKCRANRPPVFCWPVPQRIASGGLQEYLCVRTEVSSSTPENVKHRDRISRLVKTQLKRWQDNADRTIADRVL
jgi:hypothetical protein